MFIRRAVATLVVLLVGIGLFPALVAAEPQMTMEPKNGPQPGDFAVFISELTPGTTYRLVFVYPNGRQFAVDVIAGSNGVAGELVSIDGGDPPGLYTVELRDKASASVIASSSFTLNPDRTLALPSPSTPVLPQTGGGGMAVRDNAPASVMGPMMLLVLGALIAVGWQFRRV